MKTIFILILFLVCSLEGKKKKKDPRDYTDADLYKLEEQWAEDDDIEEGDLPEHKRKHKPIDMEKAMQDGPEGMLKASKKGKTLMMFATVSGNPTKDETEQITSLWQLSLSNAHIPVERFVISDNRVLFKVDDGSLAFEIRDFLVDQERCEVVNIDGNDYKGKGSKKKKSSKKKKNTKKEKKTKKNSKTEL